MTRILVRAPNWIGDQVLAYPFYYFLRSQYPHAHISVACVSWVESIQFRNLVDEVIVLPRPLKSGFLARARALYESGILLRNKGPWDLAISLPDSLSSAIQLLLSGAKSRRGYVSELRGALLTERISQHDCMGRHRAELYVRLVDGPEPYDWDLRRVMDFWGVLPEDQSSDLDGPIPGVTSFDPSEAWPDARALDTPKKDYYLIAPGSAAESRRAPLSHFLEISRRLWDEKKWIGVVVGGVSEARAAQELLEAGEASGIKLFDATANGSVSSLWALFQGAKLTLASDSGLAHVATLCGSPTFILWGAGDPRKTAPLGPGLVRYQINPVSCWPCERNTCELEASDKLRCLKGLPLGEFWETIERGIFGKKITRTE